MGPAPADRILRDVDVWIQRSRGANHEGAVAFATRGAPSGSAPDDWLPIVIPSMAGFAGAMRRQDEPTGARGSGRGRCLAGAVGGGV